VLLNDQWKQRHLHNSSSSPLVTTAHYYESLLFVIVVMLMMSILMVFDVSSHAYNYESRESHTMISSDNDDEADSCEFTSSSSCHVIVNASHSTAPLTRKCNPISSFLDACITSVMHQQHHFHSHSPDVLKFVIFFDFNHSASQFVMDI